MARFVHCGNVLLDYQTTPSKRRVFVVGVGMTKFEKPGGKVLHHSHVWAADLLSIPLYYVCSVWIGWWWYHMSR